MDSQFIESKTAEYLREIETYLQDHSIDLKSLRYAIELSRNQLDFLRNEIKNKGFKSEEQEIYFFKHTKPLSLSHLIYFLKIEKLLENYPVMLLEAKQNILKRKMASINRFHKKHASFIRYLKQEETYLDALYFTRNKAHSLTTNWNYISDPDFSTSHDTLVAKYHASCLFTKYLTHQLYLLEKSNSQEYVFKESLKWTGQKVDLIELIYALQASGVFDHGHSSVKKIAEFFQEHFECNLGDVYRSYSELRFRKKSRTKFLDQLSEQLQKKMDADDS
jgi:hypothetical protein